MAVDDQSGFAIKLLHDTSYVVTLPGDHDLTAEGGIAIFASLSEGSCSGAASEDWYYGGALEATYSFTVQLPASSPPYALRLAHQAFSGVGGPTDGDFDYHPHVTASLAFEPPSLPPPSLPPSPPPPSPPPPCPPPCPPPSPPPPSPPLPFPPPRLSPPLILMAVDDQSGFTTKLLHRAASQSSCCTTRAMCSRCQATAV